MLLDLGNTLVNLWSAWHKDREFQAWVKLVLSTIYSGFLGMFGSWGAALISGKAAWVAFGYGLCGSTVGVLTVLLRSPQSRGLIISSPTEVVKQYQDASQVVMQPDKKG